MDPGSAPDPAERVELFRTIEKSFELAARVSGETKELFYQFADVTVRMRFASSALIPKITPSISHLSVSPTSEPDLTICLWDTASIKLKLPLLLGGFMQSLSWHWPQYLDARGSIVGYSDSRIRTAFHPGPNILSMLDMEQRRGLYWAEDALKLPWFESGSPMRTLLSWWMARAGYQFVHAAAVGNEGGGVLIAGKGGSGKSTTALACLAAGMNYASDDYALVQAEPQPHVYSVYNTAKLVSEDDLVRFPLLAPLLERTDRPESEKVMFFLHSLCPERIVSGFPIRAFLISQVTGRPETSLRLTSPGNALLALAPSTLVQLPGTGQSSLKTMTRLIRQVPCYVLEAGTDVSQIPPAIDSVLSAG